MQKTDIIKSLGCGDKLSTDELANLAPECAARFHELRSLIKACVSDFSNASDTSSAAIALTKLAGIYKNNQIKVTSGVFSRDVGDKLGDPSYQRFLYEYLSDLMVNGCISLDKTHQVGINLSGVSNRNENDTFGFDIKAEARNINLNVGFFYVLVKSGMYSECVDLSMGFFDIAEWNVVIFEALYNAALQNDEVKIASLASIALNCGASIGCGEHGIDIWTALSRGVSSNDMYGIATLEQRVRFFDIAKTMEKYGIGPGSNVYDNPGRGIESLIRNGYVEVVEMIGIDRVSSLDYVNARGDTLSKIAGDVKNSVNWFLLHRDGLVDYANETLKEIEEIARKLTPVKLNDARPLVNDDPNINFDTF